MSSALPGVKVGPLDPDSTSAFGRISANASARTLIRLHAQAHPAQLVRELARPLDPERTKGLNRDEVSGYVRELKLENGDPILPDGAEVVGAQVRGKPDTKQVLTFTYLLPSGRTGKWFAPYDGDVLPESSEAGSELARVREMKERGVVAFDDGATQTEIYRREAAGLRREVSALRGQLQTAAAAGVDVEPNDVEATPGDTRQDDQIVADNEQLRRQNAELVDRLTQLEQLVSQQHGDVTGANRQAPPQDQVASADEPIEGYDEMNAHDVITLVKADDTDHETVQRILDYEETHGNRRTVTGAANERLGRTG